MKRTILGIGPGGIEDKIVHESYAPLQLLPKSKK